MTRRGPGGGRATSKRQKGRSDGGTARPGTEGRVAVVLALLLVVAAGGGAAALVWIGDGAEDGAGTEDRLGEGAAGVTTGDHRPWESYVDLDAVHDVAVAADDSVWTAGAGVHRRAPDGAVQELTLSEDGLPSNRLTSIAVAEGGVVAVGSPRAHRVGQRSLGLRR